MNPYHWRNLIDREKRYQQKAESAITTPCFEIVGRSNSPEAITLIFENGERWFANYASMESGKLKGDELKLIFPDEIITVKGKNLKPIQCALTTHRITYLRETEFPTHKTHISAIELKYKNL